MIINEVPTCISDTIYSLRSEYDAMQNDAARWRSSRAVDGNDLIPGWLGLFAPTPEHTRQDNRLRRYGGTFVTFICRSQKTSASSEQHAVEKKLAVNIFYILPSYEGI